MRGMILAAGYGTRLWPLTEDRTKPAVPYLNKPLIVYSVEYLRRFGVSDITVNLHHRPESVEEALGDGTGFGARIRYSRETEILGTGGALDRVREWLEDDDFIVVNGKIVTDIDLAPAIARHRESGAIATLVLLPNLARARFTDVRIDADGRLLGFAGYPEPGGPEPLLFTGVQVLSPRIFRYIPRRVFSHTTATAFPSAMSAGELVLGHLGQGTWREMSTLARYLEASMEGSGGANVIGAGCSLGASAEVVGSVLWDGVRVEDGAVVRHSIIGDGVRVATGEKYEDVAVVRRELVAHSERGEVRGDNLVAPIAPV